METKWEHNVPGQERRFISSPVLPHRRSQWKHLAHGFPGSSQLLNVAHFPQNLYTLKQKQRKKHKKQSNCFVPFLDDSRQPNKQQEYLSMSVVVAGIDGELVLQILQVKLVLSLVVVLGVGVGVGAGV